MNMGSTWNSGNIGDNATWDISKIKMQGQFEFSKEKVP